MTSLEQSGIGPPQTDNGQTPQDADTDDRGQPRDPPERTNAPTHVVSLQRDISEQNDLRETMQRKDELFALALEASASAVWEWTIPTDEVEYRDDMSGRAWRGQHHGARRGTGLAVMLDLVHPEDRDRLRSTLGERIAGNARLHVAEYRLRRPDGSFATISDRQFIIRDADGTAERLIGSMLDVSDKRELEHRRNQSNRTELLGEMSRGIAHNFDNLLTVILGAVDLLRNRDFDVDATRDSIRMIDSAAQRGTRLTKQLLSFSQVQTLSLRPVDVGQMIDQSRPLWASILSPRIRLQVHEDAGLWSALSDRSQLEAAILNLVVNASDAMPEGGELMVSAENIEAGCDRIRMQDGHETTRHVRISITDTGVGMSPDHLAAAVNPFFTTKPLGQGSGLGLSSTHGFITQSGGFIRLDSTPGEGTSAHLFLRAADARPDPEIRPAQKRIPVEGGHHILVVDDDPLIRDYLQALLVSLDYTLSMAANGEEAMRILASDDTIDLLFTDILMDGGMNGWELARSARALLPDLPILFTSATPEAENPPLQDLPASRNMLRKPYRPRDLSLAILATLSAGDDPGPAS